MKNASFANCAVTGANVPQAHLRCRHNLHCCCWEILNEFCSCSLVPHNPLKVTRILYSARTDSV